MLRITKEADYGIVLLSHFAAGGDGSVHTARDLAEQAHLPLPMVGKILKSLARNGLLLSLRGVHGGYRLARSPVQHSDGMRWFRHKAAGGLGFEDTLRRMLNRGRYAGATT